MLVMKGLLLVFFIFIMPFLLGALPVSLMNGEQRKPEMLYIAGWFVMFALFQIISVPFIILQQKFTVVVIVYDVCLLLLLVISIVCGRDILTGILGIKRQIVKMKTAGKWEIAGWILVVLLLLFQMGAAIVLEHYDGDDAYYVAASVGTDLYDTMYMRDAYTGYPFTLETRHALSPVPVMIAWIGRMTGIHPTIISHSVLGPVWLLLMYAIYLAMADKLFEKKKQYRPLFMLLLMVWFLFGNVSLFNTETFAMTRIWQGKGMVAAIVIPMMFLCLLHLADASERLKDAKGFWLLLLCTVFAAVLATSTSIFLTSIFLGMAGLVMACREKSWKILIPFCLCSIPAIIYGVFYLIL